MKRKHVKLRTRIKNQNKKKWFDKECRPKRHELRKLSNKKHNNPMDEDLRKVYHSVLKEYNALLKFKKRSYIL